MEQKKREQKRWVCARARDHTNNLTNCIYLEAKPFSPLLLAHFSPVWALLGFFIQKIVMYCVRCAKRSAHTVLATSAERVEYCLDIHRKICIYTCIGRQILGQREKKTRSLQDIKTSLRMFAATRTAFSPSATKIKSTTTTTEAAVVRISLLFSVFLIQNGEDQK